MSPAKSVLELVKNFELVNQSVAKRSDKRIRYLLARMYVQQEELFDIEKYNELDRFLKKQAGFFSHLDKTIRHSLAALMSINHFNQLEDVERLFEEYQLLKEQGFKSSSFTYFAAYLMQETTGDEKKRVRERAIAIYQDLKTEHPFLTSREDYVSCITLAKTNCLAMLSVSEINDITEYYFDMFVQLGFKKNDSLQFAAATATSLIGKEDAAFIRQMEIVLDELRGWDVKIKPLQYTALVLLTYLVRNDKTVKVSEFVDYQAAVDGSVNFLFEKEYKSALALSLFVQANAKNNVDQDLTNLTVNLNLLIIQEQVMAIAALSAATTAVATTD